MNRILGIDLGTTSIGWAIIDEKREEILGMGSRIFPVGVVDMGKGEKEKSRNASRNDARSVRKQIFRRKLRKQILLKVLQEHKMAPESMEDNKAWFIENKVWFKMNPYELRNQAVNEKVSLLELGRIFYHMAQRRGFQSNSRSAAMNEKSKIFEPKDGKTGITETQELLKEKTLGTYLHSLSPEENKPFKQGQTRIRNRYTTRQMYMDEFKVIWKKQSSFYSELTEELRINIGGQKKDDDVKDGILFHQRPLKSQKHVVGNCSLEPKKTRCPQSALIFEEFRIWQFVNTIECDGEKLSLEQCEQIIRLLMSKTKKIRFKALRKELGKMDSGHRFNYQDTDSVVVCPVIAELSGKGFFGKRWFDFSPKEQEDIWHILYFFDDQGKVFDYAKANWGFDTTKAKAISKFNLPQDYSNLSRKAILNILPFLKMGFTYDLAVVFGGIRNAFGEDWYDLRKEELRFLQDNIPQIVRSGQVGGFIKDLKKILMQEFSLSEKQLSRLYHHSANIPETQLLSRLPVGPEADRKISSFRNPIVIQALFELRKLVNELIDRFGSFDTIKVEMARDLKVNKMDRQRINKQNRDKETLHDTIKDELKKINQRPTHENILKYKLWLECQKTCPYTGQKISLVQLYNGAIQIEHILPYSRSLDDSFLNKTLCFAEENSRKGNQIPYEYYTTINKWKEVEARALSLFYTTKEYPNRYRKFKRFVQQKLSEDLPLRHLNDTRYISREAKNYLEKICKKIQVAPGQLTARLRHLWGLNKILDVAGGQKNRNDHRHHAVDALVLACFKIQHLQEISKWNRYNRTYEHRDFPDPWDNFQYAVAQMVKGIVVSHKKENRILSIRNYTVKKKGKKYTNKGLAARGKLHLDSVYGKRRIPGSLQDTFHIRKPLMGVKDRKQIDKIADVGLRKIILEHLRDHYGLGLNTKNFSVPKGAFFDVDENGKIQARIFLPNKRGDRVPVFKVRMKENMANAEQLKEEIAQYVNPMNNHHILVYRSEFGKVEEEVVTFWEAAERMRQKQSVVGSPSDLKERIAVLHRNDMYLMNISLEEIQDTGMNPMLLSKYLYRVHKLSKGGYVFSHHLVGGIDVNTYKYNPDEEAFPKVIRKSKGTFTGIKINISVSGKIKLVRND